MCDVPVFYATTDGQTRRVADYVAETLRARGLDSVAIDIGAATVVPADWSRARGAFVAASVYAGRHQDAAQAFVRAHLDALNARPSVFVSVSLSAASRNPATVAAAERIARTFVDDAGWRPRTVACVAGRLAYTRYGWLKRWMMRRISQREGGPTDTGRDHELTDWPAVARLANDFADALAPADRGTARRVVPLRRAANG